MLKIFLAEDEVIVRETIKRMIPWENLGFELVGEAADGEMALPLLIRQQPDLLITDIKMPFMDGLTLARLAKKEVPGLKVVILSGYDDFNYAKQAINIGVEDYLLKPITKNALIERLTEIRSRYEDEKTQREYYEKFHREMQAYEKNSSRDFFEALVSGSLDMMEVYKRAEKLGLDIVAESYNVLIFTMNCNEDFSGQRGVLFLGSGVTGNAGKIFYRASFCDVVQKQCFFLWCPDKGREKQYQGKYQNLCRRDKKNF